MKLNKFIKAAYLVRPKNEISGPFKRLLLYCRRMVEQCPPKDIHGLNSSTNEHATLHYLIKGNEMRRLCRLT